MTGPSEFDIVSALVQAETGRRMPDELAEAAQVAADRGHLVMSWRLTDEGAERLSRFRQLFAPLDDERGCPACGDPEGPCDIAPCGDPGCDARDCESHETCIRGGSV